MSPSIPEGLTASTEVFWSCVVADYDLRLDELRVLEDACREMDLIDRLSAALAEAEPLILGSMGQWVMSPLFSEIRQHRTVLASLFRALKLPDDAGVPAVNQQRSAGQASWAKRGA